MKPFPHRLIGKVGETQLKMNVPPLNLGDTVRVRTKFQESGKQRIQFYIGTLCKKKGTGRNSTRTIRTDFGGGIVAKRTVYCHSRFIEYDVISHK